MDYASTNGQTQNQQGQTPADQVEETKELRLLASSAGLGWQDIEAHTFVAPDTMERWSEPETTDITLITFMQGKLWLKETLRESCLGLPIQSGDMFLKPAQTITPELEWENAALEPAQTLRLQLKPDIFNRAAEELADRDPARMTLIEHGGFSDPLLLQISLTLAKELKNPSAMSAFYAQTTAHMIAAHLLRHYTSNRIIVKEHRQGLTVKQLKRVTDYVRSHLTEDLTLEDLAAQTGYSPYHFTRLFREAMGDTPHQFIIRQRVEQAQHLLRNTDLPIALIALETGFSHQSHLTRAFKRYVSTTPNAFRQAI